MCVRFNCKKRAHDLRQVSSINLKSNASIRQKKKWCFKISLVLGWSVRFMSFAYTCNGFIERYIWALACDATRNALKHRIRMLFYCVLINSNAQALVLLLETSYSSVCSLTLDSEWTPKYKTNSNFRLFSCVPFELSLRLLHRMLVCIVLTQPKKRKQCVFGLFCTSYFVCYSLNVPWKRFQVLSILFTFNISRKHSHPSKYPW